MTEQPTEVRTGSAQLTDSYDRKMDYLRISVTDRCNFRCQYCMPEDIKFQDKSHILTYEEMLTFAEACLQLGVTKVRVTGGEPLVRRGVVWFISQLKELGFEDVTMTTNGFLLKDNLEGLVEAGLDRINISLDTLQPEKFAFITRRDHFHKVWEAIMAALETPLSPVKTAPSSFQDARFSREHRRSSGTCDRWRKRIRPPLPTSSSSTALPAPSV
jgi:GTP 3',8-cyclase